MLPWFCYCWITSGVRFEPQIWLGMASVLLLLAFVSMLAFHQKRLDKTSILSLCSMISGPVLIVMPRFCLVLSSFGNCFVLVLSSSKNGFVPNRANKDYGAEKGAINSKGQETLRLRRNMRPRAIQPRAGSNRQRKPHGDETQQGAGKGKYAPQRICRTNTGSEQGAESVGIRNGNAWQAEDH